MSIIQSIRDKASWLIIILVVLSLIGFILMDASVSHSSLFNSGNEVGEINGLGVSYPEYQTMYQTMENNYMQQLGRSLNDFEKSQMEDNAWKTILESKVMGEVFPDLGILFHKNELNAILAGDIELNIFRSVPAFTDKNTGAYRKENIRAYVNNLRQSAKSNPEAKQSFEKFIDEVKRAALSQKYLSHFLGTANEPKWVSRMYDDSTPTATAKVISIPYYQLGMDKIEVSDDDVKNYIDKYDGFEKATETRQIDFIIFDGNPTRDDSNQIFTSFANIKEPLRRSSNPKELISQIDANVFYMPDYYLLESDLKQMFPQNVDQVKALSPGQILGGFMDAPTSLGDANNYNLVKMMKKKSIPQEVELRHILVAIQQNRTDDQAKKRIDSVVQQIRSGADFAAMAEAFSDDGGSNKSGGYYRFSYPKDFTSLDSTFGKTIFYGDKNTKRVIKSNYGYHYIEVISQSDFKDAYHIAALTKKIEPSVVTETKAFNDAHQYSILAKSKGFSEAAKNQKREILSSSSIKPNVPSSFSVLQYAMDLQRWAFREKEVGAISAPIKVKNYYVIAKLNTISDAQTSLAKDLRSRLELRIRQDKLLKKLEDSLSNNAKSFESVAQGYGISPILLTASPYEFAAKDTSGNSVSSPELVGRMFAKNSDKSWMKPIPGSSSIYFISNTSQIPSSVVAQNPFNSYFRKIRLRNIIEQMSMRSYINSLPVEDNRYKF